MIGIGWDLDQMIATKEKKNKEKGERRGETNWGGRDRPVGQKGVRFVYLVNGKAEEVM